MKIEKIINEIERRWQKKSDANEEEGGEGWVDFDDLLKDVCWGLKKKQKELDDFSKWHEEQIATIQNKIGKDVSEL